MLVHLPNFLVEMTRTIVFCLSLILYYFAVDGAVLILQNKLYPMCLCSFPLSPTTKKQKDLSYISRCHFKRWQVPTVSTFTNIYDCKSPRIIVGILIKDRIKKEFNMICTKLCATIMYVIKLRIWSSFCILHKYKMFAKTKKKLQSKVLKV